MAMLPAQYASLYHAGYAEGTLAAQQRRQGLRDTALPGTALYEAENWLIAHAHTKNLLLTAQDMLTMYQEWAMGFVDAVTNLRRG